MGRQLGRTGAQCSQRWRKVLDPKVKRNIKWTAMEDALLIRMHTENPTWQNKDFAKQLPNRTPTQCHNRWWDKVNPVLRWEEWTTREDIALCEGRQNGMSWSKIVKYYPCLLNRAYVAAKNRWHMLAKIQKKRAAAAAAAAAHNEI